MRAHRLVKARHADSPLDGEGSRRAGGRWNLPGLPLAYCASTLSLAVLELLVHLDPVAMPTDLVAIEIEIPEALPVERWLPGQLPAGWREEGGKSALQALGGAWLKAASCGLVLVPSVVVPSETNVLINPRHPDAAGLLVVGKTPFTLDPRLFHRGRREFRSLFAC